MDNLRIALSVLFCRVDPEVVLSQLFSSAAIDLSEQMDKENIRAILEAIDPGHTSDELQAILSAIEDTWSCSPENSVLGKYPRTNIFYLIQCFAEKVLMEEGDTPVCEFTQLLRWRDISYQMSENYFTTAFFAYKDLPSKRRRHFFSWNATIGTNNRYLREILERKCTDLHFHLWGSSLNFELNWLSLMNRISNRRHEFKSIQKLKNTQLQVNQYSRQQSLYGLYVKAFAIRQLLFKIFVEKLGEENEDKDKDKDKKFWLKYADYKYILSLKSEEELCYYVGDLQREADRLKYQYGCRYENDCVDYAIPCNLSERNYKEDSKYNIVLYGERWMMYKAYKIIFSNAERRSIVQPIFYAYLLIQNRIRKELVQLNNNSGFHNFQEYQNRKTLFIGKDPVFIKLLANLAVNQVLNGQQVSYLEVRMPPKKLASANLKEIHMLDEVIQKTPFFPPSLSSQLNDNKNKYFYIYHFLKRSSKRGRSTDKLLEYATPRQYELRCEVKEQTMAINIMRRMYTETKQRLVGIDAASAEIGNRPEIFGQSYRYLKKYSCEPRQHIVDGNPHLQLGYTYHVGEDFMDIADGLRAIDEAVRFLNLNRGDRLGHALALGIHAKEYYQQRSNKIILSRQDFLDNVMWLLTTGKLYNVPISPNLDQELNVAYRQLIYEIYEGEVFEQIDSKAEEVFYNPDGKVFSKKTFKEIATYSIPLYSYYQSWLLRGDAPEIYLRRGIQIEKINHITFWEHCGLNHASQEYRVARANKLSCAIYQAYHFNPKVIERGNKTEEYKISAEYIEYVSHIQRKMQIELARKHIAIECNPTSNKLIGCYQHYANHPISRFFNIGLVCNHEEIAACPQLSVSINTDDLGVFSTNLENEYALMAIALEKEYNIDGTPHYTSRMIYDWLDKIRQMGFEQRFRR